VTVTIIAEAEADLESAFDYYQGKRSGLGRALLDEFRIGIDRILENPQAWPKLGDVYRRYRLHRFPYGIVYRQAFETSEIIVVALMHFSRKPGFWHGREQTPG
jgi:plasmid stabilization system protein ParE